MKLHILKDKQLKMQPITKVQNGKAGEYRAWAVKAKVDFPVPSEENNFQVHYSSKLKSLLESMSAGVESWRDLAITFHFHLKTSKEPLGDVSLTGKMLNYLGVLYKSSRIQIQLLAEIFGGSVRSITTKEMNLIQIPNVPGVEYFATDNNIALTKDAISFMEDNRFSSKLTNGRFTITILLDDDPIVQSIIDGGPKADERDCDAIILAKDAVSVGCHKNYLCIRSPVLMAIFENKMKPPFQNRDATSIKMDELPERSVRALLAYLYHDDITGAIEDVSVGLDLLEASEKYLIPGLKGLVSFVICMKDEAVFTVEGAIRLFLFSTNIVDSAELKEKAVRILKRNSAVLNECSDFRNLFNGGHAAATLELCQFLLQFV